MGRRFWKFLVHNVSDIVCFIIKNLYYHYITTRPQHPPQTSLATIILHRLEHYIKLYIETYIYSYNAVFDGFSLLKVCCDSMIYHFVLQLHYNCCNGGIKPDRTAHNQQQYLHPGRTRNRGTTRQTNNRRNTQK